MGKLGAGELNYSSDIDLILLYDRDAPAVADNEQLSRHFVRGARLLVQLMSEASADGYIFRTDLRLRPDPGATPLAMSACSAAESLLREPRPELGTRRHDQGAPGRRRHRRRSRGLPSGA
jgi:glutamate-ammonia-ligase adenylyltransferase